MGAGDELGGACAAAGELEEGHLVCRAGAIGRVGSLCGTQLLRAEPVGQPLSPAVAIEQHQLGTHGLQQFTAAIPACKQRVGDGSDKEPGADLLGIGGKLQPVVAEQRIDRRHPDLEQGEEHQIELGHVGQLHQGGVADPEAMMGESGGQPGRARIELAVAETALAAENGRGIRRRPALAGQHGGQGLAAPVTLGAILLGQILGPAAVREEGIGLGHSATSGSKPSALGLGCQLGKPRR
ncbi:hypothetical protein D3C79_793820 [compost metagenome]